MRSTSCLIVILAAVWSLPTNADGQGVGRAGGARAVGGYPGGPAIGGFGGGVGGRSPGNRFGGNLRNSPTFRPAPSLTPQQTFRPYPSLSPGLNFNPPGSLFRPQRGADARPPVGAGNGRIVGLPHASRLVAAPSPLATGGAAPTTPANTEPVIRIGSLGSPDQVADLGRTIDKVRARSAGKKLFSADWFATHENSWHVSAIANHAWETPSWLALKYWLRIEQNGFSYFYGTNVNQRDDEVFVAGKRVATAEEYRHSARELAGKGQEPEKDKALWMSLGVFAVVRTAEPSAVNEFIQLAVDMDGMLRGTWWNQQEQTATIVKGSVDTRSQRTAWRIERDQEEIYEAGIFNLSGDAIPLMVHTAEEPSNLVLLVRLGDET